MRKESENKSKRAKTNNIINNKNIIRNKNDKSLKERIKKLNITDRNKRATKKII